MKLEKKMKVFCLRKAGKIQIKLLNSNEELYKIVERLKNHKNGFVDLSNVFNLNFSKKTFSGLICEEVVQMNLYENQRFSISIIELEGDYTFSLEEIKNSKLFIDDINLLRIIGINDNILHEKMISCLRDVNTQNNSIYNDNV